MKEAIVEAIQACASRRIQARDVARGFLVSLPARTFDDHLVELNFIPSGDKVVVSDAGEFYSFLHEEGINDTGEAVLDSVAHFERMGIKRTGSPGQHEFVATASLDDVGCISIDFANALAAAEANLLREHREGAPRFQAKVWRDLGPMQRYFKRDVEVVKYVRVPFYAPDAKLIAITVGSYGRTVEPLDIAERETSPLFRLNTLAPGREDHRVAIVMDDYLRIREVRDLVSKVAEVVPSSRSDDLQQMVRARIRRL